MACEGRGMPEGVAASVSGRELAGLHGAKRGQKLVGSGHVKAFGDLEENYGGLDRCVE